MRRAVLVASVALSLVLVVYAVAGFQLYSLGKSTLTQAKSLSENIGKPNADGAELKAALEDLSIKVSQIESKINQGLWKPIIWLSGQKARFRTAQVALKTGSDFLSIAPGLMGLEGARTYLIAFQNPAEARGTGGIIGGYASIRVINGKTTVLRVGSNVQLHSLQDSPVFISKEFTDLYGSDPGIWQNSNMSPHFPYGAQIWLGLWKKQFGESLDGVIAIDPIALSSILKVIGPVTMADGQVITSANVVEQTLSLAYQRFAADNTARKGYLVDIAKLVLQRLVQGGYSKIELARQLSTPAHEGRTLFYSTHGDEEKIIEPSIIGGALSEAPNDEFRVVVENTAGNKMDYYLDRNVKIKSLACSPQRNTQISVTLTNSVDPKAVLPTYVMGRLDLKKPQGVGNSHGVTLFIYGPPNSKIASARFANRDIGAGVEGVERKRPVLITKFDLKPRQPQTLVVEFDGGKGPISIVKQPLVRDIVSKIDDSCND